MMDGSIKLILDAQQITSKHSSNTPKHRQNNLCRPPSSTRTLWPVELNVELVGVLNILFRDKYGVEGLLRRLGDYRD